MENFAKDMSHFVKEGVNLLPFCLSPVDPNAKLFPAISVEPGRSEAGVNLVLLETPKLLESPAGIPVDPAYSQNNRIFFHASLASL